MTIDAAIRPRGVGVIAALLPDPIRLTRLRSALRDRHEVVPCADHAALIAACRASPVHMVVVELRSADGALSFDGVRQIRASYPRIILVAYIRVLPDRVREVFEIGRFGFDGLIVADQDDAPHTMFSLIEQAEARGLAAQVRRAIGDVNPTARDALLAAVSRSHEALSPDGLARVLGISRRLMARYIAQARFPRPQRLLTWGRLIVAAHMLEDPRRSADGVAYALAFPSGSAFRNTCQRYLGSTPHEIRACGGAAYTIGLLQAEIAAGPRHGPADDDGDGGVSRADPDGDPEPRSNAAAHGRDRDGGGGAEEGGESTRDAPGAGRAAAKKEE